MIHRRAALASAIITATIFSAAVAFAQTADCTPPRTCSYLALVSRPFPQPTATNTPTPTATNTPIPATPTPTQPAALPLIPNGGFENGAEGWSLAGGARIDSNPATARTGNNSLVLGGDQAGDQSAQRRVDVPQDAVWLVMYYTVTSNKAQCTNEGADIAQLNIDFTIADELPADTVGTYELCASQQVTNYRKSLFFLPQFDDNGTVFQPAQIDIVFEAFLSGGGPSIMHIDDISWSTNLEEPRD